MVDLRRLAQGLQQQEDGIWYPGTISHVSYPKDGHTGCFAIEDDSFWFRHRNTCLLAAMRAFPPQGTLFDIGGGNGVVAAALAQTGHEVVLLEPGQAGALQAKKRGLPWVICGTLSDAKFHPSALPAGGVFDVLEHIEDDRAFLTLLHRLLKEGGRLYVTVPAYPLLWSYTDEHAGHYRRYILKSLMNTLESCGFEVEFSTYFFQYLPAPIWLLRTLPTTLGFQRTRTAKPRRRDHAVGKVLLKKFLESVLNREAHYIQAAVSLRFGGSCLVVAKSVHSKD